MVVLPVNFIATRQTTDVHSMGFGFVSQKIRWFFFSSRTPIPACPPSAVNQILSFADDWAVPQFELLYPTPALVKAKDVPLGVPIAHPNFISSSIAECARVTSPPKSNASALIKT
jgi:hypothetical protein